MGDIRLNEAGIPVQSCPACGQEVVPSYNGWRRHQPYCPAAVAAKAEREAFVEQLRTAAAEEAQQVGMDLGLGADRMVVYVTEALADG